MAKAMAVMHDSADHDRFPAPVFRQRIVDEARYQEALGVGLGPVAAQVLAARHIPASVSVDNFVNPCLRHIEPPDSLADMDLAVARLCAAVTCEEVIGVASDYDVDGLTGHALVVEILTQHFGVRPDRVISFVGHRLQDGYGICDSLADTILSSDPRPGVLITIDNGSSDEARIARLSQHLDVIVTDHHALPPEGPPASAFACINPQREDCSFPDPSISGGFVAWLLMWTLRRELIDIGHLPDQARSIADTLDFVACSVVADCVDLRSASNRAAAAAGLRRIPESNRCCWKALQPYLGEGPLTAASIAFGIGPRLNARTRMSSPHLALDFLRSSDEAQAEEIAALLERNNNARRQVEREMRDRALSSAVSQFGAGACCLTIYDESGHAGVQGIVSSRIVELFGCPTLMLSRDPADPGLVCGSARSVEGVDIRAAMAEAAAATPGSVLHFGGHASAAGIKLIGSEEAISAYSLALDAAVSRQLGGTQPGPIVLHDGELTPDQISLATVDDLARLEPYGRGFPAPVFRGVFDIVEAKSMGKDRTHLRLTLSRAQVRCQGVWFSARRGPDEAFPVQSALRSVALLFELKDNWFRARRSLQLVIRGRGLC